jgi:outer membrane immunogenic protein
MLRKFLLATFATVAFANVASAADLPARAPAVPYVAPYSWTGFYAGVNVGGGWGRVTDDAGASSNLNGVIGGGQIGYNWQMNNLVLGVETDFQGSGQRASSNGFILGVPVSVTGHIRYFGTVRGRIGYAWDRWMVYATGGWAYTNVGLDVNTPFGSASSNTTKSGATVGGGVEWAFAGPWSAKLEYLYIDTGTQSVTLLGITDNARIRNHIGRVGLNYRF